MEASKSLGMNYLSKPNFLLFKESLERNTAAGMDLDSDCLKDITSPNFNGKMNLSPKNLKWRDFLKWPRDHETYE